MTSEAQGITILIESRFFGTEEKGNLSMAKVRSLKPNRLHTHLNAASIPYADSRDIPAADKKNPPQPRALQALELALHIQDSSYNIYLAGNQNLGRTYMLRRFLEPRAAKTKTPDDILYVFNFENPDKPRAIRLPAGQGRRFKTALGQAVSKLRKEVPGLFDQEHYIKRRQDLRDTYQDTRQKLFSEMEDEASQQGFNLNMDEDGGLTLYPLIEGKLLSEDEFEKLDSKLRSSLKIRGDKLLISLTDMLRKVNIEEQGLREHERTLDREVVSAALEQHLAPLDKEFSALTPGGEISAFLKAMKNDLLDNLDNLAPKESYSQAPEVQTQIDDFFNRYDVNLFVDHAETKGAPIVVEDHPTPTNLLGCVERESEMGALVTDFTLIKAGSLHKALGGFLVLHMEDILQHPTAWEGLMRALRSGLAKIEEGSDGQDQSKTKTIEPEPLAVETKVILIGADETYEMLLNHEDRFPKLFKIKAHMQDAVHRTAASVKALLPSLRRIIDEGGLKPFDREALARLVDEASRLAEDQRKLSLKLPLVRELMIEASALADMEKQKMVDGAILRKAIKARHYRSNLYEEEFMEEYNRELIKVATSGHAVGRVNGLSVTWFGDFEFGLPHQIACTVGVGREGVLDLEREADLGGPIHTKAMMILKSYLLDLFAQNKPLILSGSLCFEQSYVHVEGDSASGAELAALLSALARTPIDQSLAFTGAVSQSGDILAVGGVSPKIEGFFHICDRRGLTGQQGVVIPVDNVDHLMLKDEVVQAVEQGKFHIYPVRRIEQAMELLTGLPAGRRLKNGGFTANTLYRRADDRLAELAKLGEKDYSKRRK